MIMICLIGRGAPDTGLAVVTSNAPIIRMLETTSCVLLDAKPDYLETLGTAQAN